MLYSKIAALLLIAHASAQYPGHGISKSTYSSNDPIPAWSVALGLEPAVARATRQSAPQSTMR
jgi:hypothetical protein